MSRSQSAVRRLAAALAAVVSASCLLLAGPPPASADHTDRAGLGSQRATGWYLALGDSLAAGYQPGQGDDPTGGYVGGVLDALTARAPKTRLVNLACSGENTRTMIEGGRCSYDEGSQLAQAVEFLHAHGRHTRLVTLTLGANDVVPCARPAGIDLMCIGAAIAGVQDRLPTILAQLRAAAPRVDIVVTDYYNPFLVYWFTDPALAAQSTVLQAGLNAVIAGATASVNGEVAGVAAAFASTDTTPVDGIPTNVTLICAWTWMCQRLDIHANDTGYAVMAQSVVATLD